LKSFFIVTILDHCPPLEVPDNGTVYWGFSSFIDVGDICVITCDKGFELIGSTIRTCLGNQTWSGTEATCKKTLGESFYCLFEYNTECKNGFMLDNIYSYRTVNSLYADDPH